MEEKKPKQRGDNWTAEEKEIFIEIMKNSSSVVNNTNTDTNTNKEKQKEWLSIKQKFQELSGKERDVGQLKGYWRRTRVEVKKRLFKHSKDIRATGGGPEPPPPAESDIIISQLCPADYIEDKSLFDSDNQMFAISHSTETTNEDNEVVVISTESSHRNEENEVIPENHNNCVPEENKNSKKRRKVETSHKASVVDANILLKQKATLLMEQEYALKLEYQRQELAHQDRKHKLEVEILLLEKQKKELELLKIQMQ